MPKFIHPALVTVCSLILFSGKTHSPQKDLPAIFNLMASGNHAPVVKFLQPLTGQSFEWNTTVPYSVDVSDAEDGESAYAEINEKEVWVRLTFAGSKKSVDSYRKQKNFADTSGVYSMVISNCFNCHAVKTKLAGPSFQDISLRYAGKPDVRSAIERHIREGSTGIWGKEVMPTHPELEQHEIKKMVGWILQYGKDPGFNIFVGLKGALPLSRPKGNQRTGYYLVTAFYADHGSDKTPSTQKTGAGQILLGMN